MRVLQWSRKCGGAGPSCRPTGNHDSIDQVDRSLERLRALGDLAPRSRVHGGVGHVPERAQLGRAEHERPDGGAAAAVDEVVGAEPRQLQLRLLDREQVLDRLRDGPVTVLQCGVQLAQLVVRLGKGQPRWMSILSASEAT